MRTAQEIVNQTNEIAAIIYSGMGYQSPEGFEFHTDTVNRHPHETNCWNSACEIQERLTQTDPNDAVDELDEE